VSFSAPYIIFKLLLINIKCSWDAVEYIIGQITTLQGSGKSLDLKLMGPS